MALTTNITLSQVLLAMQGQITTAAGAGGLATPSISIAFPGLVNAQNITNGTNAANKVNQFYSSLGTLAASTSVDIDLYALGGAVDIGGNAYTMTKLKLLIFILTGVVGAPVEADYVILGNKGTTAGWAGASALFQLNTDSAKIFTGGFFAVGDFGATAYAVGASTTDHLLTLTSGANSGTVQYQLIVAGTTT